MGEGEGGMIWENGIETCIISYKKLIVSPGSIQDAWGWCTGMTQRDGVGRKVGGGIQDGEHMYTRGGFMPSMAKTIAALSSNQPPIKINKF